MLAITLAATASAYYHFVHYAARTSPWTPIREKFDLSALANKTLYFYVSDQGPAQMAPGDSLPAILSQIRFAGRAWNAVDTSDLRVAYGGLFSAGAQQATPHMEVVFTDELPPGLLAQAAPTVRADVVPGPDAFVPILRSTVYLNRDLSQFSSYGPSFAMTVTHEMGHALGLQHTLTSSTMSTDVTRATTKALPLAPDDIAGISLLYPNAKFGQFGSLTGQVTMSGNGVHMASVVALTSSGWAVSALTNPDGTYRIDGLRPGEYYVYAHALPPSVQPELGPSEIVLPLDSNNQPIPAGDPFQTQFYPGTQDPQQAVTVAVSSGATASGINFAVERRAAEQIYSIRTYSFPGSRAVHPAFENINVPNRWLVATGNGLMPNGAPAPGLGVSLVPSEVSVRQTYQYSLAPNDYLQINLLLNPFSGPGPRHLVFSAGEEIYVLPSALSLANGQPPWIDSVAPDVDANGNRVVSILGTGFAADTRILFDGAEAAVNSFDSSLGKLVATPPPGASAYRANVIAVNSDGQTSEFLQDPTPYTYDASDSPAISLSTSSLPAGVEAMIEVNGVNTNFTDGRTVLGFGSSDVVVKRLWVLSPTHLRAEVVVNPAAPSGSTLVSVTSGFQVISQPFAFVVLPGGGPLALVASSDLTNAVTGQPWIYPGSQANLSVSNLPASATVAVTLNDVPVTVMAVGQGQITFQVPADFPTGSAVLRIQTSAGTVYPIAVLIDPPPPVVINVAGSGAVIDASRPARPGDLLTVTVSGLADAAATVAATRLRVTVGGVDHQPIAPAQPAANSPGQHQMQILLSEQVPAGQVPLTVTIDYRTSAPYTIPVQAR